MKSYFGLRKVTIDGRRSCINGKPVFQRLILDQGFYPDGIWTAPSDEALKHDIELSMAAGYNGARLHQKVFEPRFLYWADKLGYLVWGEFPNWGYQLPAGELLRPTSTNGPRCSCATAIIRPSSAGARSTKPRTPRANSSRSIWQRHQGDRSDPAGAGNQRLDATRCRIPRCATPTTTTRIPAAFKQRWMRFLRREGALGRCRRAMRSAERPAGTPACRSWSASSAASAGRPEGGWGYGAGPKTWRSSIPAIQGLIDALLDNPNMFGFCYTQLTDVEQEQNGLVLL